jgi:hypothetical protein
MRSSRPRTVQRAQLPARRKGEGDDRVRVGHGAIHDAQLIQQT